MRWLLIVSVVVVLCCWLLSRTIGQGISALFSTVEVAQQEHRRVAQVNEAMGRSAEDASKAPAQAPVATQASYRKSVESSRADPAIGMSEQDLLRTLGTPREVAISSTGESSWIWPDRRVRLRGGVVTGWEAVPTGPR